MATIVSFVVKDLMGQVVRKGACFENVFDKQFVSKDETIHIVEAGEVVEVPVDDSVNPVFAYAHPRHMEYPDIREQLDAIWEVLGTLPDLPQKTKLMYDRVMTVKENFPKGKRFMRKSDGSFIEYEG